MTTIAWDGATLAADRLCSGPGLKLRVLKIRRTAEGWLLGASGDASACHAMLDWVEGGHKGKPPVPLHSEAWGDIIMISPEGVVWFWGPHGRFPTEDTFAAIGSGRQYAISAMSLGMDAAAAVGHAARFDPNSGGGVLTLTLEREAA